MTGLGFGHLTALALLAFGLAGGVAYEVQSWLGEPAGQPGLATREGVPANAGAPVGPAVRTNAVVAHDGLTAWRNEILSRPLFSPGRRPAEAAGQHISGLSRLTGIILTGTRRVAIFAGQGGGVPIIAEEGARLGPYEVQRITDTSVTVEGPEGVTVIRPVFDAAAPAPAKPKPPAPTPAAGRAAQVTKP